MLNLDFSKPVVIETSTQAWEPSPMQGVWRKKLSRAEEENGHATSVVRYDANSQFHEHDHPQGEEIFVLDGVFSDHTGDYPKGTYFRNPAGFKHAPFSKEGCTLFVKLHQFQEGDTKHLTVKTSEEIWQPLQDGLERLTLHQFKNEHTFLLKAFNDTIQLTYQNENLEIFLMKGNLTLDGRLFDSGTWLRKPSGQVVHLSFEPSTIALFKTGHF